MNNICLLTNLAGNIRLLEEFVRQYALIMKQAEYNFLMLRTIFLKVISDLAVNRVSVLEIDSVNIIMI